MKRRAYPKNIGAERERAKDPRTRRANAAQRSHRSLQRPKEVPLGCRSRRAEDLGVDSKHVLRTSYSGGVITCTLSTITKDLQHCSTLFSRSHAPRGSARPARSACEGLSCCGRREMNHPSMRIPQQWTEDRPSARADAGHRREKEGERLHLHVAGHLQHRPRIPGVEVRARASASFTSLLANPVHETIGQPVPMCTKLLQKRTHLRNMSSCLHREQQTDNTCNRNLQ